VQVASAPEVINNSEESGAVQCSELQEYLNDTIGLADDGLTGG